MTVKSIARRGRGVLMHTLLGESESSFSRSYSQQGEDCVLACLFQFQRTGFYVDVGAHHPVRHSNTRLFYRKGWRGINIDPRPGIMTEFARRRPEDINLEIGISNSAGDLTYYVFSEPTLNTFDRDLAQQHQTTKGIQLIERRSVRTYRLAEVLNQYLPAGKLIDFLSIDAEGLDEEILSSNNWTKYRPRVVVVEDLKCFTFQQVMDSKITRYMNGIDYVPISKMVHTLIYCEASRVRGSNNVLVA